MRRRLLALTAVVVAVTLTACGDDTSDEAGTTTTVGATTSPPTTVTPESTPPPTTVTPESTPPPTTVTTEQGATTAAPPTTVATTTTVTSAGGEVACDRPVERGRSEATTTFAGEERAYVLHVPPSIAEGPAPLVMNFHGLGSSGAQQHDYADLEDEVDELGAVLVSPDGTSTPRRWPLAGIDADDPETDSIAFARALVAELDATWCIDEARVFATGMSYGGIMSSALACFAPDLVAAVAPVAATAWGGSCFPGPAVDVLAFHGTDDDVVAFDGSSTPLTRAMADAFGGEEVTVGDIAENVAGLAGLADCEAGPAEVADVQPDVELRTWSCPNAEVGLYVIEGGGHTWPGADSTTGPGADLDATALIVDFFERNPR